MVWVDLMECKHLEKNKYNDNYYGNSSSSILDLKIFKYAWQVNYFVRKLNSVKICLKFNYLLFYQDYFCGFEGQLLSALIEANYQKFNVTIDKCPDDFNIEKKFTEEV